MNPVRFFHVSCLVTTLGLSSVVLRAQEKESPQIALAAPIVLDRYEVLSDRALAADNSELEARRLASTDSFTGVTREEFARRANRRAGDIVARLPGTFMGGPPGENNDVRLRGLDKEYTRTQVDGITLSDGGEKRELQLNRVPADLIQEIRILRNPGPEFESDGVAGRLDLRFRQIPKDNFTAELRAGAGQRQDTDHTRLSYSATITTRPVDAFGLLVSYNYLKDPVVKIKAERTYNAAGVLTKDVPEVEDKPVVSRDLFVDAAWYYKSGELHFKPLRLETIEDKTKTKTTQDYTKAAAADLAVETEREYKRKLGTGFVLSQLHRFGENGPSLDSRLSWNRNDEDKPGKIVNAFQEAGGVLPANPNKITRENEDKSDKALAADSKFTLPIGASLAHVAKFGFSTRLKERERMKTKTEASSPAYVAVDKTGPKDNYFLDEDYYAVFAQDTWTFAQDFSLLGGARYEVVDFASRTPVSREVDARFKDFNPSLQFAWRARPDLTFKAAASRALNRPKFDELSPYEQRDTTKVVVGNPALRPTRSRKIDFAVDFVRENVMLAASAYHQHMTGVIEQVATGNFDGTSNLPIYQTLNVGDGWVQGVEFEQRLGFRWAQVRLLNGFSLWTNQTWLRSEVTDVATNYTHTFKEQPKFLANVGFDYELGRVYLTASARYTGSRLSEEASKAQEKIKSAETIIDAALHVRLFKGLSLYVEASNLTNEYVNETTTVLATNVRTIKTEHTGRSYFAGLRARF